MFAIVNIQGQQFKVSEGQEIFVHRLDAGEGEQIAFNEVLLVNNEGTVQVGNPTIKKASVNVTVLGEQKGDKVIVFKKKRRKGYRVKKGHRQQFTKIKIDQITA
jgi:large subunit ribosomal protein L21